jgi:hypothetical protein
VATYEQYKAMGYQKLHGELKKMLKQSERIMLWFNEGERENLR